MPRTSAGGPPTLITVRGVTKPLQQWAADNGLHPNTIRYRLKRDLSPEEAVAASTKYTSRVVTIDGDTRPLAEWLRHYNRNNVTFYYRIARGYSEHGTVNLR